VFCLTGLSHFTGIAVKFAAGDRGHGRCGSGQNLPSCRSAEILLEPNKNEGVSHETVHF